MTHIEERRNALRSFIAKHGGFAAVATKFNLSQSQASYLSQLTAKDSTASFGERSAKNWEERLRLPEGTLIRPTTPSAPLEKNVSPGPDVHGRVPLISWFQAGALCQTENLLPPGKAERWFDCPVSHSASTFTLRVRGDSMTAPHGNSRTYPEGCFIFIDPEKRMPDNGDRILACLGDSDEVTFKAYKNEDGRKWLQPLNPSHEPIRQKFKVLGTVLGKWEDG